MMNFEVELHHSLLGIHDSILLPDTVKYPNTLYILLAAFVRYTIINPEDQSLYAYIKLGVVQVAFFGKVVGTHNFFQF